MDQHLNPKNIAGMTGPAVFVGGWALAQLWLFWVAPIIGGALAGFAYHALADENKPDIVGDRVPS